MGPLFASAAITTAQQPPNPPQISPDPGGATLKVTSRLTLVDGPATDSKDKPVHGLVQSVSFEIRVPQSSLDPIKSISVN